MIQTLGPETYLIHAAVNNRPLYLPLLIGEERTLLIDTGSAGDPERYIWPALAELGVPREQLGVVLITHSDFDHHGGNAEIKRAAPHVLFACGVADRAAIESPDVIYAERYDAYRAVHGHAYSPEVKQWIMSQLGAGQPMDLAFVGGERLRLGPDWEVEIAHLPGHSHGHLGVLDHKHRTLFGGDAIHGAVYLDTQGEPALCPTYLHVSPYLDTIAKIETLPIDRYVGCHWPVMQGREAILAFCAESRVFVERAESAIQSSIRRAGVEGTTLTALCRTIGPLLGQWPDTVHDELCYLVAGHLADLKGRGLIDEHRHIVPYRYSAAL